MKNLTKPKTTSIFATALISLFMISQSAMALDEEQEKIPPPNSHMTSPHEHKLGNAEDGTDPANDKKEAASTKDGHHEIETVDDTKQ